MEENQDFKTKFSHMHNMKDLEKIIKNFISNLQYQEFNFTGKDIENDYVFNLLNKKEREELLAFFNSNKLKFINSLTDHIIKRKVPNYNEQISALIYTENAMDVYSNKIKKEISKITKNINEFEIKYLSIMLVGKSGVGKSTLINSVLKSNFAKEGTGSFQTINIEAYKSKNMPIFRLIDTRGIELNKNYGAKDVKRDTEKYIKDQYSANEPNNFVHCIWYCITGKRFEKAEIELLNYLRNSYGDNNIPVIIIYTQSWDENAIMEMEKYIKKEKINASFIRVLARTTKLIQNKSSLESFGLDELVNVTLEKCKKAMRGEMRTVMTKNITNNLKTKIIEENKYIREYIYEKAILEFTNNYKLVKNDEEFLDYIIKLFSINIQYFLEQEINNKSINFLKNNRMISDDVQNFTSFYKREVSNLMKDHITRFAIKFIDYQVIFEKNQNKEIQLNNKRCIAQFQDTSTDFLNKNYYYTAQAHYLYHNVLGNFRNFTLSLENSLNQLTQEILNQNKIQKLITECFLKKFEEYEKKANKFFNKIDKVKNDDKGNNNIDINNYNECANNNNNQYGYQNNNVNYNNNGFNNYHTNQNETNININFQNFNMDPNDYPNIDNQNYNNNNKIEINFQNFKTNNNISNNYPNLDDQNYDHLSKGIKTKNKSKNISFNNSKMQNMNKKNNILSKKYSQKKNINYNGNNAYNFENDNYKNFTNQNENNTYDLPSKSEIYNNNGNNYGSCGTSSDDED